MQCNGNAALKTLFLWKCTHKFHHVRCAVGHSTPLILTLNLLSSDKNPRYEYVREAIKQLSSSPQGNGNALRPDWISSIFISVFEYFEEEFFIFSNFQRGFFEAEEVANMGFDKMTTCLLSVCFYGTSTSTVLFVETIVISSVWGTFTHWVRDLHFLKYCEGNTWKATTM